MKKNIFIKTTSLILALVTLLGLCACGGKDSKTKKVSAKRSTEPVTITYYYCSGPGVQQYTQKVQDKLNEILANIEGYENITIELHPYGSSYLRDLTLAQATGVQIDLVNVYGLNRSSTIKNGDLMELDDLMNEFPDMVESLPDWVMNYGKLFGHQYYIPSYQQAANLTYIVTPTEYLNMYLELTGKSRKDVSKLITTSDVEGKLDFLEDLCNAVRAGTGLDTKWINTGEFWASNLLSNVFYNQEYIGTQFSPWIFKEGADAPEYFGYTEDYKTIMERFAGWYKDGLLHPEVTTVNYHKFIEENFLENESYVCQFVTDTCSEEYLEKYMKKQYGIDVTAFRVTDHAYIPSEWEAGGQAVYTDCEHPYEAMMIIDLLRTEKGKEFYNTLVYGLEGVQWKWEDKDKDRIVTLEYNTQQGGSDTSYAAYKWNNGNVLYAYKNQAVLDGFYEYIENEVNNGSTSVKSPAMGITWDLSNVSTEISQCQVVESEYVNTIYISKDWEKRYNDYIKKLEAAGVQTVLDEMAKQFKEFKKK